MVDNCPPFRPIMSAIKTTTYNLVKFPITANIFPAKTSFEFAKEIADHDQGIFVTSLDVEFPFTNIPLEEAINVCCDSLFRNDVKVYSINRIDVEKLLRAVLKNDFFNFEG